MRVYGPDFSALGSLTGPGGRYELEPRRFRGTDYLMFKNGPRSLSDLMACAVERNRGQPNTRMTEQDGATTSYGAFESKAAALARALSETLGVNRGEHVAIAMGNRVEWMISFFAIIAAGAVPVMVNTRGAGEEMDRAIRLADCVASICDYERHVRLVSYAAPSWPSILLDAPGRPNSRRDLDFAEATQVEGLLNLKFAPRAPEDPALILFSSGTTGHPKAIVHDQGGMAHSLTMGCLLNEVFDRLYEAEFDEPLPHHLRNSTSTLVLSSPLFHVAGLLPYMRAIMNGQATVLVSKWSAETLLDILERETISRLGLVPTMMIDLLNSPRLQVGLLDNIRFLANGTAALSPAIAAKIREALPKCLMLNTYGQTETMERVATFGGQEFEKNLSAVGRVMPATHLRIVREDGSDANPGETGEICARTASTMVGYYKDAKSTAATIRDGWVHTGDVGRFDESGLLHIIDRKKNMVISGGENIYCAEVERVLGEHPAALEAFAYGEPDPRLGERLVVVVVLRPGANASEDEMKAYAKARLAIYKVPRRVTFTNNPLPRNATGKVARGVFMDQLKATSEAQSCP